MLRPCFDACRLSVVAAVVSLTAGSVVVAAEPSPTTEWPQAHSDLPADPAILFGTLANGMRYAIMQNATPKGAVAMRFVIDAGSLQESDAQQGLAHFLEHMAFRGSRHVPEDQIWPGLQRLGMAIGADANAHTGSTRTQYEFDLPRNDPETIDAGLMRLREDASELTLAQRAMDDERGVILSEERLRATPDYRGLERTLQFLFPAGLGPSRMPIGKTDIIEHAPISLIRDFYTAYYRPERATLIVVGDIDPKVMEAKIAARFADWKAAGPAGGDPRQAPPAPRGPEADLFVEPGASSFVELNWVTPYGPDTKAREQADLVERIGLKILEYRLQDLAGGAKHPFAQVGFSRHRVFHSAYVRSVKLVTKPQDWRLALGEAVTTVRRLDQYGVTTDEAARATNDVRAQLQTAAANAATRRSPAVAQALATSVDEGAVFIGPAERLTLADETFKNLTAETVTAALRDMMRSHGPLLFLSSPAPIDGGKAALIDALAGSEKAPLAAAKANTVAVWPYTDFGPPGQVVDQKVIEDLQTTFVRFANGVRLTVKPTSFATGEILVDVRIGDGRRGLAPDQYSPAWAVADGGFAFGGMKAIGVGAMRRALAGKIFGIRTSVTDEGLMLGGRTRPADLATQLQILAAYVNAPGWRVGAIDHARTEQANRLVQESGSPMGVFWRDIPALVHGGDRRWSSPSLEQVQALQLQDLKSLLEKQLASAPIDVKVVGDITVDRALQDVAATFGALPRRSDAGTLKAEVTKVNFPAGVETPIERHHKGRADQGVAAIGWPTVDVFDLQNVQALTLLGHVFATRLLDELRIRDGATYSPGMLVTHSKAYPGYGFFLAHAELPSAKMPLFFNAANAIAADLRANAISDDELERARKPTIERLIAHRQTNAYWSGALLGAQSDPRRLDIIRDTIPGLRRVTPADVRRVAQTYLVDSKAWKAVIVPEPTATNPH